MASSSTSIALNSTNSVAYLTSDRTELAPLCSTQQDMRGLRTIISCLAVFTVFITLALLSQLHQGDFQVTPHGTVVSDDKECSEAGVDVMRKGGSAVDAVIATLFCLSVVMPHLVGIGGGGHIMVYDQRRREVVECLDFRPKKGDVHSSIGVPGFVAGLSEAHNLHGKLPWASLLNAAIQMAGSGFKPSANLLSVLPLAQNRSDLISLLTSGRNLALVDTLKALSVNGSDELYTGDLSNQMIERGLVSADDLAQYRVESGNCQQQTLGKYQLTTAGRGSGGPLLLLLLNKTDLTTAVEHPILSVALGLKETQVVSRQYNSGLNVVATDHNDIYVTAVCGLGSVLGSMELTKGGYLMNNVVGSSELATPVLATQTGSACGHRFVMGANDMRDIAQLWLQLQTSIHNNHTLESASEYPRVRIFANQVKLEINHDPQVNAMELSTLQANNFTVVNAQEPYPSLNIIHKYRDLVTPVADTRGGGFYASF